MAISYSCSRAPRERSHEPHALNARSLSLKLSFGAPEFHQIISVKLSYEILEPCIKSMSLELLKLSYEILELMLAIQYFAHEMPAS